MLKMAEREDATFRDCAIFMGTLVFIPILTACLLIKVGLSFMRMCFKIS